MDSVPSFSTISVWKIAFKCIHEVLEHDLCNSRGGPKSVTRSEIIVKVHSMVLEDC